MRATKQVIEGKMIPEHAVIPAKERLKTAAARVFQQYGVHDGKDFLAALIAKLADSNVGTLIKHFGSAQAMAHAHLLAMIREDEALWTEAKRQHTNNAEAELLAWLRSVELHAQDPFSAPLQLSRASASLYHLKMTAMQEPLKAWRLKERFRIRTLCKNAEFDEPDRLADKIWLLAEGARNERMTFDYDGPRLRLVEGAKDLIAAHRERKLMGSPLN